MKAYFLFQDGEIVLASGEKTEKKCLTTKVAFAILWNIADGDDIFLYSHKTRIKKLKKYNIEVVECEIMPKG